MDEVKPPADALRAAIVILADLMSRGTLTQQPYGDLCQYVARELDRFRAEERERCFKWAIGRRSRSRAAQAIRDGEDPNGHPLDPSLCWRCGTALHPGHYCGDPS